MDDELNLQVPFWCSPDRRPSESSHKIALADIKEGEKVIKYGFPIGVAKQDIKAGSWVHVHNVKTGLGDVLDYEYNPSGSELEPTEHAHFMGYRREDGRVGVRNEIWIIPTVGCFSSEIGRAHV